ncbi:MAG TPA: peptidoglycan editing factor PgeF [Flavilitoribacter sp.]|nr:peptidoglycan editing factor PgeF [Flavilitoribacter sp.]HMQ88156.1 peptidoglycan editing factor PgeF [Flavilitoribacter sp.]
MPAQSAYFRTPAIFTPYAGVLAAESTRKRGFSLPPYDTLNLGLYTSDNPETVKQNRASFFGALGFNEDQAAGAHQVHGDRIKVVEAPGQSEGYDALITDRAGILLTITVADCAPVLILDPVRGAIGAAHAGWRGTVAGIAGKTLGKMKEVFRSRPEDCLVYIGTCIDVCCFEVGDEVAAHFTDHQRKWNEKTGKYHVDNKAALRDQLRESGILPANIEISPYCTFDRTEYFSHRRDKGLTGRMLGVIGMRG